MTVVSECDISDESEHEFGKQVETEEDFDDEEDTEEDVHNMFHYKNNLENFDHFDNEEDVLLETEENKYCFDESLFLPYIPEVFSTTALRTTESAKSAKSNSGASTPTNSLSSKNLPLHRPPSQYSLASNPAAALSSGDVSAGPRAKAGISAVSVPGDAAHPLPHNLIANDGLRHFWALYFGDKEYVRWSIFVSKLEEHLLAPRSSSINPDGTATTAGSSAPLNRFAAFRPGTPGTPTSPAGGGFGAGAGTGFGFGGVGGEVKPGAPVGSWQPPSFPTQLPKHQLQHQQELSENPLLHRQLRESLPVLPHGYGITSHELLLLFREREGKCSLMKALKYVLDLENTQVLSVYQVALVVRNILPASLPLKYLLFHLAHYGGKVLLPPALGCVTHAKGFVLSLQEAYTRAVQAERDFARHERRRMRLRMQYQQALRVEAASNPSATGFAGASAGAGAGGRQSNASSSSRLDALKEAEEEIDSLASALRVAGMYCPFSAPAAAAAAAGVSASNSFLDADRAAGSAGSAGSAGGSGKEQNGFIGSEAGGAARSRYLQGPVAVQEGVESFLRPLSNGAGGESLHNCTATVYAASSSFFCIFYTDLFSYLC
jgi:hypothetical protein